MTFRPGVSGNPAGRPKKLLKRIDEVLHDRGIEPIAEVLRLLDALRRQRFTPTTPPKTLTPVQQATFKAKEADRCAWLRAAARDRQLEIWLELLPYFYAPVKEEPDDAGDSRTDMSAASTADLLRIVLAASRQDGRGHEASGSQFPLPEKPELS